MRLIDADANEVKNYEGVAREAVLGLIAQQPTVDADPVVHAYWIVHDTGLYPLSLCSKCHKLFQTDGSHRYCPNCGAKMDKEMKNDD